MKKDKDIKEIKHLIFFKIKRWWRQIHCLHYWVKYKVLYNPNKYPSKMYRKCTECRKIEWANLYGQFKGK